MSATPGWYRDPSVAGQLRYFDGMDWTGHVQPDPTGLTTLAGTESAAVVATTVAPVVATAGAGLTPVDASPSTATPDVEHQDFLASGSRYPTGAWGRSTIYRFDGGAATYLGTCLLAVAVAVLTLGVCIPFSVVLLQRWRSKHTYLMGHRLRFTGMATHLFGLWLKWWFLTLITLGIYSFWVMPRLVKWMTEHTDIDPDAIPEQNAQWQQPAPQALPQSTGPDPFPSPTETAELPQQGSSNWYS